MINCCYNNNEFQAVLSHKEDGNKTGQFKFFLSQLSVFINKKINVF